MAKKQPEAATPEATETADDINFATGGGEGSFEDNGEGFVIDMSGVDENAADFPVLPRGLYPAIVEQLDFGPSKNSGNPMWSWRFEISEGEYAGQKLFYYSVLTAEQLPRLKKVLMRIAPELLETAFNPKTVADQGVLIGKACTIRVDVKPYEGKPRNNVRDVLPAQESTGGDTSFL